ncbi:hypothetical protein MKW92_034814 [Papaver armeniacum]|nr:hypothetical protein MKW92_034814 [Papaver armeniacum]
MADGNGSAYFLLIVVVLVSVTTVPSTDALSTTFYHKVCPKALPTIKKVVNDAVSREMGKTAFGNNNSLRGFEVVDRLRQRWIKSCGAQVVSCADILAVAARDSVVQLGGQPWKVELGRRDSTTASRTDANNAFFQNAGLDETDLVALSGGHAIGFSQCNNFKNRIYNESNIDPLFARNRKLTCPPSGGDTRLAPFDPTAVKFDTLYFKNLVKRRGLLHSDQALFNGVSTDALVKKYSTDAGAFAADFGKSMIKMGRNKPLEGNSGQIRVNCRRIN